MRIAFRVTEPIDGDCEPVADLEVGARFRYTAAPSTWSTALTDGDGLRPLRRHPPRSPARGLPCSSAGSTASPSPPIEPGTCHMLEL